MKTKNLKGNINKQTIEADFTKAGYTMTPTGKTTGFVNFTKQGVSQEVYLTNDWHKDCDAVEISSSKRGRKITYNRTLQKKLDGNLEGLIAVRKRDQESKAKKTQFKSSMEYMGINFSESYVPGSPALNDSSCSFNFNDVTDAPKCLKKVYAIIRKDPDSPCGLKIGISDLTGVETPEGFMFIQSMVAKLEDALMVGSL